MVSKGLSCLSLCDPGQLGDAKSEKIPVLAVGLTPPTWTQQL